MPLALADMRADLDELVHVLADSHPDPYSAGGGKIAFHRRADAIRRALPDTGLSAGAFLRRLRPLVASVGDGHTSIGGPRAGGDARRLWLGWGVVEDLLHVREVYRSQDRPLLGARLRALGGVRFGDLVERMRQLTGSDNEFDNLRRLAVALRDPGLLADLLDRDGLPETVPVAVQGPEAPAVEVEMPLAPQPPGAGLQPATVLAPPATDAAGLGWGFLGDVAVLRIDSMGHHREAFESWRATGYTGPLGDRLAAVARAALGGSEPPADLDARIALVPSATELLRSLVAAMRERRTQTLLVDLRANPGGNSLLGIMLIHFLYGIEATRTLDAGCEIPRYSALYRENHEGSAAADGYDFSQEVAWRAGRLDRREELQAYIATSPTFAAEIATGTWAAARSPRVIVLTSAFTYSSAYQTALFLRRLGAKLVGVPSGQAGNVYGDTLGYRLSRSGLHGDISYKRILWFPDGGAAARVLRPDREVTYADLVAMGFDPNASLRLALERATAG